jgi:transcription-repair coupling factor (superfamily II helicase)
MALRPLLARLQEDPDGAALTRDGGRAFVSQSLRPYLVAALADGANADRPTLVVAGDDRQARDLAADLRSWLAPRSVRFYPSRGVAYESHLAPPPHLVGLRVAALDALLEAGREGLGRGAGAAPGDAAAPRDGAQPRDHPEPPVVVVSAVALS